MDVRQTAGLLLPELSSLRRELHRYPETGLHLPRTQELLLAALADLPLEISVGTQLSSIVAVLRGAFPGKTVLLRADMDGLPVPDLSGLPFASERPGYGHACGHDLHAAALVGAAKALAHHADSLHGDVVFMFQPGEEGYDGAAKMIEEGVLAASGTKPDHAYALHVVSNILPRGRFAGRAGPILAAADGLVVRVIGKGGHAASPHLALDPVPAACEMVVALQTVVTRRFAATDPVVVTVGKLRAGEQRNIIAPEMTFEATLRSFSSRARELIATAAVRLCRSIGEAHGLTVEAELEREYPATVNDADEHRFAMQTARSLFGEDRFEELAAPIAMAEDFSRILEDIPGAFLLLGATTADDPAAAAGNHSPYAAFDESALSDGAALLAGLASRRLSASI